MKASQLLMAFILASLFLTATALAQPKPLDVFQTELPNILGKIAAFLADYIGIIFILLFLLILLMIAGIVKLPRGGMPSPGLIMFTILIILAFVLPQVFAPFFPSYLEVPENFRAYPLPAGAEKALGLLGLPESWAYVPAIIYLFILPFAAIYTLVWSFLVTLGIFTQANVNRLLALIITFLTIPIGWFTNMVWALFSLMGAWSVAAFAAMFIAGIFFRGAGIAAKEHMEFRKYVQMQKKGLSEIIRRLEEAKKGTVETMREEAAYAIGAAPSHNMGARALRHLQTAANPETKPEEVKKYIERAIEELKKEL